MRKRRSFSIKWFQLNHFIYIHLKLTFMGTTSKEAENVSLCKKEEWNDKSAFIWEFHSIPNLSFLKRRLREVSHRKLLDSFISKIQMICFLIAIHFGKHLALIISVQLWTLIKSFQTCKDTFAVKMKSTRLAHSNDSLKNHLEELPITEWT